MENKKMCSAVVVAAGNSTRFGGDIPKQFALLDDKPVLYHSLKALCESPIIDEVILVTSEDYLEYCADEIVKKYGLDKIEAIVLGGQTRCDSVRAGIMVCDIATDYVFIHDGARPYLTQDIIERGYETVLKYDTAVAAIPSTDTIKIADSDGVVLSTPDRRGLWRIQTPQIFKYDLILHAYFDLTDEDRASVTDDAMLIEQKTDTPVHLFMGSESNIKITTKSDLA